MEVYYMYQEEWFAITLYTSSNIQIVDHSSVSGGLKVIDCIVKCQLPNTGALMVHVCREKKYTRAPGNFVPEMQKRALNPPPPKPPWKSP